MMARHRLGLYRDLSVIIGIEFGRNRRGERNEWTKEQTLTFLLLLNDIDVGWSTSE